jgi:amidase
MPCWIASNILLDDPDAVDGAPCAIQVIAPRFQDEKCLWAAAIVDRDIRS